MDKRKVKKANKRPYNARKAEVEIKKLGINGEGIGYINKKICFVDNALPSEVVEIEILEETRKYYKGKVIRTIKESKHREETFCKEDTTCLGCALTRLAYPKQLSFKKDLLKDALKKYTTFDVESLPIKRTYASPVKKGYRNSVALPITYFNGKVLAGIYQRESKYLTFMNKCPMQNDLINETIVKIEDILNKHGVRDYNDKIKRGLRFMRLRNVANKIQVLFVTGTDGMKQEVVDDLKQIESIVSIFYTINTTRYQEFEAQGYAKLHGNSKVAYKFYDQQYLYSIKSEFPVNPEMEKTKMDIIKSFINEDESVISLNCGIGVMELSMDNEIVAIDPKNYHIQDAEENMKFLRKSNVKFLCKDIDEAVVTQCKKKHFDVLVLRHDEMSRAVKQSMILSKINKVIYVCDHPSSLAKDLEELKDNYIIETMIPLDMNPYSAKVETVVKLVRK